MKLENSEFKTVVDMERDGLHLRIPTQETPSRTRTIKPGYLTSVEDDDVIRVMYEDH